LALVEVRRARELSPYYPVAAALEGDFLMRAQRVDEAIQRLEDARQQNENFWLTRKNLAEAYLAAGRDGVRKRLISPVCRAASPALYSMRPSGQGRPPRWFSRTSPGRP